jgi:hypothetical protein
MTNIHTERKVFCRCCFLIYLGPIVLVAVHQITLRICIYIYIYRLVCLLTDVKKTNLAESRVKFSRYAGACSFVLGRIVVWLGRRYVWIYSNSGRYLRERCLPCGRMERICLTMFVDGRLFAASARDALWFFVFLRVVLRKDAKHENAKKRIYQIWTSVYYLQRRM